MSSNKPVKVEPTSASPMVAWDRTFGFPMFRRLSHEFDEMFGRFGFEKPFLESMPAMWAPEMEMFSKEDALHVKFDVPGMKKEEVTVEVNGDHLVVRGERKEAKEDKKEGVFRTERSYGSFYRAVPLPEGVKSELAKATMHDGVLEISMPMVKVEEKTRKLEIGEPTPAKSAKAA